MPARRSTSVGSGATDDTQHTGASAGSTQRGCCGCLLRRALRDGEPKEEAARKRFI
eukprot:gene38534-585_t